MLFRVYRYITVRPYWLALLIIALLLFWMLAVPAEKPSDKPLSTVNQQRLPKVQITRFSAQTVTKYLTLYGRSEANSRAVIRSEVAGKIMKITTQKGFHVKSDSVLAYIEKSELPERLAQAHALLDERLLNYKAAKSLNEKGLQGRAHLAEMKSLLLAAKSAVKQLQLRLKRTTIVAPFAGILQAQFAEPGDYLKVGDALFSLENIDPIVIRGDATEHYVKLLSVGQAVSATLLSGQKISGKISYIAALADLKSSTFRIEAEFANADLSIFSGFSAKLTIPLYPVTAIYVSPSVLAMDEQGNLGVKLVKDDVVVFKAVNLVEADNDGAWLSGFSGTVDIITLGQGFVNPGDRVQAIVAEKPL